jgi:heme-degrading monooxygenase HmoA
VTADLSSTIADGPALTDQSIVVSIVKVRLESGDVKTLLAETFDVLQLELKKIPGFLGGEILVSLDGKAFVVRTEWANLHAWSRSRYDARVGTMLEHCGAASKQLEFEVYARHANVAGSRAATLP